VIVETGKTGSISEFRQLINSVSRNSQVKSILVLACDGNDWAPEVIAAITRTVSKPIFGGIFPGIISGEETLLQGTIVAGFFEDADVQVVSDLSNPDKNYEAAIEDVSLSMEIKTVFVFVDAMSQRITAFVDSLFNVFGLDFNYIGGGAGSLSFKQNPCLLINDGLIGDSAILVKLGMESGIGVSHGWYDVEGPYKVTESFGTTIRTLDWKPALEVYQEIVARHSGLVVDRTNFFEIAKSYPFGINKLGAEKIVRDPVMTGENGTLVCVGEVPAESHVHILTGDERSLVDAARMALNRSENSYHGKTNNKTILFIDCISRALFLGKNISRELAAVYHETCPLIGALTIGEVANNGKDYLEFYNKTAVVGVLEG
jgi:hypothetical protein